MPVVSDCHPVERDQFQSSSTFGSCGCEWCACGCCRSMDTAIELVCCREVPVNHDHRAFRMLRGERELLEVAMLSLRDFRAETLERPINSNQFLEQCFCSRIHIFPGASPLVGAQEAAALLSPARDVVPVVAAWDGLFCGS
ncbi:unnamed protein product [Boreogadus saida]